MSGLYQIPGLILTVLCHIMVAYYMNEQKYSKKMFTFFSGIYAVMFVSIMGYGFALGEWNAFFSYIGIVVLLFFYFCVVSQDSFPKKSFLFMTYACLFSVLDNGLKIMVRLFLPQISETAGYYVAIVMRNLVLLWGLILYKKYAKAVLHSLMDEGKKWWNLALCALLFYVSQIAVTVFNEVNIMPDVYLLLTFVAISVIMCVVYDIIFSRINYMKKDAEAALVRQNAEYLSSRMSVLQDSEAANRRLRHDMRHHMEIIAEYAKAGDTSALLAYIGEYSNEISETAVNQYSLNRTINNILSVYADKAEKGGVSFMVRCNVPGELKVREIDLIALLGNLLENALHGCLASGKEKLCMEVYIRLQNNRLVIVCDNSCSDELKLSGSLPAGKGVGISSILSVCQRYSGDLDYRIKNGVCSACAVLNL